LIDQPKEKRKIVVEPASADQVQFATKCAALSYEQFVVTIGKKPAPMVANFAKHREQNELHIISFDGNPVGYVVFMKHQDALFIDNIAIMPLSQGNGIAGFVFAWLNRLAAEMELNFLRLYTNEKMTGNLSLYQHLGFRETHRGHENGFSRVYFEKPVSDEKPFKGIIRCVDDEQCCKTALPDFIRQPFS